MSRRPPPMRAGFQRFWSGKTSDPTTLTTSCTAPRLPSSSNYRYFLAVAQLPSSKAMSPRYEETLSFYATLDPLTPSVDSGLEIARIGHGRRSGRVSQRWVSHASARSRRVRMTALAKAMKASITRVRRSVQMASFLKPRLCQELVRSMTHRLPAWSERPLGADHVLAAILGQ